MFMHAWFSAAMQVRQVLLALALTVVINHSARARSTCLTSITAENHGQPQNSASRFELNDVYPDIAQVHKYTRLSHLFFLKSRGKPGYKAYCKQPHYIHNTLNLHICSRKSMCSGSSTEDYKLALYCAK